MLTGESIKSKSGSIAEKSIRKAGKKQDAYAYGGIKSKPGSIAEKSIRKAGRKQGAYAFGSINQIKIRFYSRKKHTQGRQEAGCVCFRGRSIKSKSLPQRRNQHLLMYG